MNVKLAITIVVGIAIIVGIGYGISNSESDSNEDLEIILDEDAGNRQFTVKLSDGISASGP